MIRPKIPPLISGTQFAAIVVLTIALSLIIDFGRRTTAGYYVSQEEKRLQAEIATELALKRKLEERLEYVKTDAFVERWAREVAHMVRVGDRPLVLVRSTEPHTQPNLVQPENIVGAATPAPNWHAWWRLFLDTEPGTLRPG
jgi:hypothetical protein